MSLDSKLRQIAVDNHHSNSVITMEYITYLKMYAKFYGKQYMGRESRLKLKAYKSVRENYE